jgi:hypothetical protein
MACCVAVEDQDGMLGQGKLDAGANPLRHLTQLDLRLAAVRDDV